MLADEILQAADSKAKSAVRMGTQEAVATFRYRGMKGSRDSSTIIDAKAIDKDKAVVPNQATPLVTKEPVLETTTTETPSDTDSGRNVKRVSVDFVIEKYTKLAKEKNARRRVARSFETTPNLSRFL